jgi:hypothetical protein
MPRATERRWGMRSVTIFTPLGRVVVSTWEEGMYLL